MELVERDCMLLEMRAKRSPRLPGSRPGTHATQPIAAIPSG